MATAKKSMRLLVIKVVRPFPRPSSKGPTMAMAPAQTMTELETRASAKAPSEDPMALLRRPAKESSLSPSLRAAPRPPPRITHRRVVIMSVPGRTMDRAMGTKSSPNSWKTAWRTRSWMTPPKARPSPAPARQAAAFMMDPQGAITGRPFSPARRVLEWERMGARAARRPMARGALGGEIIPAGPMAPLSRRLRIMADRPRRCQGGAERAAFRRGWNSGEGTHGRRP